MFLGLLPSVTFSYLPTFNHLPPGCDSILSHLNYLENCLLSMVQTTKEQTDAQIQPKAIIKLCFLANTFFSERTSVTTTNIIYYHPQPETCNLRILIRVIIFTL